MKFDDMKLMVREDFKPIDKLHLVDEACRDLFGKYAVLWADHNYLLSRLTKNYKDLSSLYYRILEGQGTAEENKKYPHVAALKITTHTKKVEVISSFPEIAELEDKMNLQKQKVDLLRECMDNIKFNRTKDITNAITMLKYDSGLM